MKRAFEIPIPLVAMIAVALAAGADPNEKDPEGHYSVKLLLDHGANPNAQDDKGKVSVRVLDGHCLKAKGCENPLLGTVSDLVREAGYNLTGTGQAKNKRERMEVWYKAGNRATAEVLVKEQLRKWVSPSDVKEWTWGGEFHLLIVVAGRE